MPYQFIVNQQEKVYQKNLGPNTTKIAREMKSYNQTRFRHPLRHDEFDALIKVIFFNFSRLHAGSLNSSLPPIDFPLSGGYFIHKWVFKAYTFYPPFVLEKIVLIFRK